METSIVPERVFSYKLFRYSMSEKDISAFLQLLFPIRRLFVEARSYIGRVFNLGVKSAVTITHIDISPSINKDFVPVLQKKIFCPVLYLRLIENN